MRQRVLHVPRSVVRRLGAQTVRAQALQPRRRQAQAIEIAQQRHRQARQRLELLAGHDDRQARAAEREERGGRLRGRQGNAHGLPSAAHRACTRELRGGAPQLLTDLPRRSEQPRQPADIQHDQRPDDLEARREVLGELDERRQTAPTTNTGRQTSIRYSVIGRTSSRDRLRERPFALHRASRRGQPRMHREASQPPRSIVRAGPTSLQWPVPCCRLARWRSIARRDGDAAGASRERHRTHQQTRGVGAFDDTLQPQPGGERDATEAGQRHVGKVEDHRRADARLQHEIERFQRAIDRALEQRAGPVDRSRTWQPRRIDGRRSFS